MRKLKAGMMPPSNARRPDRPTTDAVALLPADDSSSGFDKNADSLGVSPAPMERDLAAASKISRMAGAMQYFPTLELQLIKGNPHNDGILMAFLPKEEIRLEVDLSTPPDPAVVNPNTVNLVDNVEGLKPTLKASCPARPRRGYESRPVRRDP